MSKKLLLLHGAIGSKAQFNVLKTKLEDHFDVYSLNFEGHGGRLTTKSFSIELFAENVLDFLDDQGLDKVQVFGYSMGGYVALKLALQHPDRIEKVTTLGTKFNWDLETAEKEVSLLNPDKVEDKIPHYAAQLWRLHQPQDWKQVMNKTADMMMNMANGAKLSEDDFNQIQQKVTLGWGSEDQMVTLQESEEIAKLLPNGTLITLDGIKHPIESVPVEELMRYILSN